MIQVHASDISKIAADINLLMHDLNLLRQGKNIIYAIDFSEIYAYAKPYSTRHEIRVFSDDNDQECSLIQARSLAKLFLSSEIHTTILPPHILELNNWSTKEKNNIRNNIADLSSKASSEMQRLISRPTSIYISQIARELDNGLELDPQTEDMVINYFMSYAGTLMTLVTEAEENPFVKLRTAVSKESFIDYHKIISEEPEYDEDVFIRWRKVLNRYKSNKNIFSTANDALAIAQIYHNNKNSNNTIIRLVTRDTRIERLARNSSEKKLWASAWGNPIRNTRMFGFLHATDMSSYSDVEERSSALMRAIQSFLKKINNKPDNFNINIADTNFETVKKVWHEGSQIATSIVGTDVLDDNPFTDGSNDLKTELSNKALGLLRAFTSRENIRNVLVDRISLLVKGIEGEYHSLAWKFDILGEKNINLDEVTASKYFSHVEFNCWKFKLPYAIKFRSSIVRALAVHITEVKSFDADSIFKWLRPKISSSSSIILYERLLLMAYLDAVVGNWEDAKLYADAAINVLDKRDLVSDTEATFLRVVCLTRACDEQRYICEAINIFNEYRSKDDAFDDPRMSCELASIGFRSGTSFCHINNIDPVELSLNCLRKLGEDVTALKITVLNNLCFYFSEIEDVDKTKKYFLELTEAVNSISEHVEFMWPALQDTLAWSEYIVYRSTLSSDRLKELVNKILSSSKRENNNDLKNHMINRAEKIKNENNL